MKRILFYILSFFMFIACGNDDNSEPGRNPQIPTIIIENKDIILNTEDTSTKFSFKIDADWTISTVFNNNDEWFRISPSSGKLGEVSIFVDSEKNETFSDRNGIVKIKSGNVTEIITITQKKKNAIIASKDKIELNNDDEIFEIEIQSNIDYEVVIPEEFQLWISKAIQPKSSGLTTRKEYFKVTSPVEEGKREGYISFRNGDIEERVQIFQAQKDLLILTSTLFLIGSEGLDFYKIDLRTNIEYQIIIPDGDKNWISVNTSNTRSARNDIIYLKIDENKTSQSRSAELIIKDVNSNLSQIARISQSDNAFFILGQNPYNVKYNGVEKLEVEMSTIVEEYNIIVPDEEKDWISLLEIVKGKNGNPDRLYFKINANETYSKRTANIKIQDKNSSANVALVINQEQNDVIIPTQREIVVNEEGGTFEIEVQANVNFEVIMPEISWLEHVQQTRELSSNKMIFRINEYFAGPYNRTAEIKFRDISSDTEDVVTVIQISSTYGIYTNRDIADFNMELSKEKSLQKKAVLSRFGHFDEKTNKWYYRLMQNVHATYHTGWKIIDEFSDIFDGQNFIITRLDASSPSYSREYWGLFSKVIKGGMIKNLTIQEINVTSFIKISKMGGFCGYLDAESEIVNCTVGTFTGTVRENTGGIVAVNYGTVRDCMKKDMQAQSSKVSIRIDGGIVAINYGTIVSCKNESNLTLTFSDQGGICGTNFGKIISCTNEGNIIGDGIMLETLSNFSKGGICGKSLGGSIIACINKGIIGMRYIGDGIGYFGGICGTISNTDGLIISCISSGDIISDPKESARGAIGGICGNIADGNYCVANYSIGQLGGEKYIGGVTGIGRPNEFQITSNFWLEEKGASKRFGDITNTGNSDIIGRKTIGEMQNVANDLNQAINTWNQLNPRRSCKYEFYGVSMDLPLLKNK